MAIDPRLPRFATGAPEPVPSYLVRLVNRLEELLRDMFRRMASLESATGTGGAVTTGTTTIDFGTFPGSNEASVAVGGQPTITAFSSAQVQLVAAASGSHTANDAKYAATLIALTAQVPVAGLGFTIFARSLYHMQGTYLVRWTWS